MPSVIENGKSELVDLLKKTIQEQGPISFAEWMEQALYHPTHGYYSYGATIGRKGDFYTSVSIGPLFGEILARQFSQMWESLGPPQTFHLCEQGAHDGQLMVDVLSWFQSNRPEIFASCKCYILQPSTHAQPAQLARLQEHNFDAKVSWISSVENLSTGPLIFYSNELIDSFPVHRVQYQGGQWHEMCVGWSEKAQNFEWILCAPSEKLAKILPELALPPIENYIAEISLRSREWMQQLAKKMNSGYVVTIDYGYLREQLYHPQRPQGVIACYFKHLRSEDPFVKPGLQDITTHIDFSALIETGEAAGLKKIDFTDQHHWIVSILSDHLLQLERAGKNESMERLRALKTLMHPEIMGTAFKVLIQEKRPLSA